MAESIYNVIREDNCFHESMTKEQILTAIQQAVSTGEITDVDTGFVTRIKELNSGVGLYFWVGTNAEYIQQKDSLPKNTFAIISDDNTKDTILNAIDNIISGAQAVGKASYAVTAENATKSILQSNGSMIGLEQDANGVLKFGDSIIPYKKPFATNLNANSTTTSGSTSVSISMSSTKLLSTKQYSLVCYWQIGSTLRQFNVLFGKGGQKYIVPAIDINSTSGDVTTSLQVSWASDGAAGSIVEFKITGSDVTFSANNTVKIWDIYEVVE